MDWDGVGTFALFLASGAVGISVVMLKAYKLKVQARLEQERLRRHNDQDTEELLERVDSMQAQISSLTARVDFNERLLESGSDEG